MMSSISMIDHGQSGRCRVSVELIKLEPSWSMFINYSEGSQEVRKVEKET